jgi:hypothetical protein
MSLIFRQEHQAKAPYAIFDPSVQMRYLSSLPSFGENSDLESNAAAH